MKPYVATLMRRRKVYVAVLAILLVASAIGTYYYSVATYESRTRIWVEKPVLANLLDQNTQTFGAAPTPAQVESDKLFQLVQADSFMASVIEASKAAEELSGASEHDREVLTRFRGKIAIGVAGPNTLTVVYRDKDPELCQQVVQGIVDQFEKWNLQTQIEQSSLQLEFYQKQLDIYAERVKEIQQQVDDYYTQYPNPQPGTPQELDVQRLQRELESARGLYSAAAAKIAQAGYLDSLTQQNQQTQFQILDKATVPELPAATLATVLRFLGISVGGSIGALAAIIAVVTWLDSTVRTAEDVERVAGVAVVGVMPDMQRGDVGVGPVVAGSATVGVPSAAADLLAMERSFLRQWVTGTVD